MSGQRLPPVPVLGQIVPAALSRVTAAYDPSLEGAAVISIDYSNRRDTAHVAVSPDLAAPESASAYQIQAAVMAALEGFRRYRRGVTRTLGTRAEHEADFARAYDNALYEIQQLIHHIAPSGKAYCQGTATEGHAPSPMLPDTFPYVAWLRSDGIYSASALADATDAQLTLSLPAEAVAEVRAAWADLTSATASTAAPEPQQEAAPTLTPVNSALDLTAPSHEQQQPSPAQAPAPAKAGKRRGGKP